MLLFLVVMLDPRDLVAPELAYQYNVINSEISHNADIIENSSVHINIHILK